MQLQQGGMNVLEYASKFIELSYFTLAFVVDERLNMNWFEVGVNPAIKERMSVRQYTSYVDLYDTPINVERAIEERSNYSTSSIELKGREMSEKIFTHKNHISCLLETITPTTTCAGPNSNARPRVPAMLTGSRDICPRLSFDQEAFPLWEPATSDSGLPTSPTSCTLR